MSLTSWRLLIRRSKLIAKLPRSCTEVARTSHAFEVCARHFSTDRPGCSGRSTGRSGPRWPRLIVSECHQNCPRSPMAEVDHQAGSHVDSPTGAAPPCPAHSRQRGWLSTSPAISRASWPAPTYVGGGRVADARVAIGLPGTVADHAPAAGWLRILL